MAVCIPRFVADKLVDAFKTEPELLKKLSQTDSAGRRELLSKYLDDNMAQKLNANFEEALLSNQKDALKKFVEKTLSPKEIKIHSDLINRIDKYKKILTPEEGKAFMQDLAARKLGIGVTEEEARTIVSMKNRIDETKALIPEGASFRSPERIAYGEAVSDFKEFVGDLKLNADKLTPEDFKKMPLKSSYSAFKEGLNMTKSLLSSLDNSFFGRQGIRTLYRNPDIWARNFAKSWADAGKSLIAPAKGGMFSELEHPVMKAIKADVYSSSWGHYRDHCGGDSERG